MEEVPRWKVLVSSKEKNCDELVERLKQDTIDAAKSNLEVCDISFVWGDRTFVQAELKTLRDMVASITDCRYYEQSAAMSESKVPFTFYLIHGARAPGLLEEEQVKLQHAMTRVQASGQMSSETHISTVYITSRDGIFEWIRYVYKKLQSDPENHGRIMAPLTEQVRHNFGSKPANRSQSRVYIEQLSRLTGIGEDKARSIAKRWSSFSVLCSFLRECVDQTTLIRELQILKCGLGSHAAKSLYLQTLSDDERGWQWNDECQKKKRKRE